MESFTLPAQFQFLLCFTMKSVQTIKIESGSFNYLPDPEPSIGECSSASNYNLISSISVKFGKLADKVLQKAAFTSVFMIFI